MGLFLEKDVLTDNVANETMKDFLGSIKVYFSDTSFNISKKIDKEICVSALSSRDVLTVKAEYENKYSEYIYAELYDEKGELIMRKTELYVPPKFFEWKKPDIDFTITDSNDGTVMKLTSNTFTKGVYIDFENCDPIFSSNFFDITSREEVLIKLKTSKSAEELLKEIKIKSVYDIGR